jgi:hypothetical protein
MRKPPRSLDLKHLDYMGGLRVHRQCCAAGTPSGGRRGDLRRCERTAPRRGHGNPKAGQRRHRSRDLTHPRAQPGACRRAGVKGVIRIGKENEAARRRCRGAPARALPGMSRARGPRARAGGREGRVAKDGNRQRVAVTAIGPVRLRRERGERARGTEPAGGGWGK